MGFLGKILFLVIFAFAPVLWAKDVLLFSSNGKPVDHYLEKLEALKKDDVVIFSDGKRIKLVQLLGEGGVTRVFETESGLALRLTKKQHYADDYVASLRELEAHGIKTPHVISKYKAEYTLMEKIRVQFTMADLLVNGQGLDPVEKREFFSALVKFAESTARYLYIGDFRPDQIAFDGKNWILLDATNDHLLIDLEHDMKEKELRFQNVFRQFDDNYIDQIFGKGKEQILENAIASRRILLTKKQCAFVHL